MASEYMNQRSNNRPVSSNTALVRPEHTDADRKVMGELSVAEAKSDREYVTGVRLFVIVATVAFISFLMLLDNMIVSTVGGAHTCASCRN